MLSSFERGNINKRLSVLKVIFNIEDSIVKIFKDYFPTNSNDIQDVISSDSSKDEFLKKLNYRANANKSISKTFTSSNFMVYDFLEKATMGDLIAILEFVKPGLKRQISPKNWNFKQTLILLGQITNLRNKVSHSSLMPVDDHIYSLKQVSKGIVGGEKDRKMQYNIVLKVLAKHYELGVQSITL